MIRATASGQVAGWGAGWLLALAAATAAPAQHTPDPFKPWNSQYEQYVYPSYPNGYGVTPNQALLEMPSTRSTGRQFQRYLEELDALDAEGLGSSSTNSRRAVGVPYYRAYRQFDRTYKRVYTPNEEVDRGYDSVRQARDEKYSQYLAASDPKERARLWKEYTELSRRAQRDLVESGRGMTRRPPPEAAPAPADLPPVTTPRRHRLPALSAPRTAPSAVPTPSAPRRGTRPPAADRNPDEVLRRSEGMDRPATPILPRTND